MSNNVYGGGAGGVHPLCCFHPRELVVGVCAHCLKERLLLVKSSALPSRPRRKTSSISLPKVLALGSFLQRLDSSRHHRPDDASSDASIASLDDSFISIKFEDNGKATWDSHKAKAAAAAAAAAALRPSSTTVVVEHVKRGGVTRWRKQVVGRLLQLARWKRPGKAGVVLDGKKAAAERSKGRSWIRSFTRRRHGDRAWS